MKIDPRLERKNKWNSKNAVKLSRYYSSNMNFYILKWRTDASHKCKVNYKLDMKAVCI